MCTSIMAGIRATARSLILLARNEDFTRNNWNKFMVVRNHPEYVPAKGNPAVADGVWTLGNGLRVPVPTASLAYSAMPDAAAYEEAEFGIRDRYFFEERGFNELGVAMSATNSMATNDTANEADPFPAVGIAETVIPTLILPQAESARHGVELLGGYVESCGASEPNGVLIADATESWYVEIGSAHHWIAVRVPDDSYLAVANGMRVHDVDLDSSDIKCSPGLFEFVVEHGLLPKANRKSFDFARAFGVLGVAYNTNRIWLAQKILTPSRVQDPDLPQYPMFLQPDRAIEVRDVMGVLRATYEGTVLEHKAKRPIGVARTAESHILTIDPSQPRELQGMIWQALSSPLGAPYMPLFAIMDEVPASFALGGNQFGVASAYWAFRGLYALGEEDMCAVLEFRDTFEQQAMAEAQALAAALPDIYDKEPETAMNLARGFSTGIAQRAVDRANRTREAIMTQMAVDEGQAHAAQSAQLEA